MAAELIKGGKTIAAIKKNIEKYTADIQPHLAIVRVGEKADDLYYQNSVVKKCEEAGIDLIIKEFLDTGYAEFLGAFRSINDDPSIDGILLLRPLPKDYDEDEIRALADPDKDIDCMSPISLAAIFEGREDGFAPCTAEAVVRMMDMEGIDVKGKEVVVIGRSMVVGKPLAMMLLARHATITICHTRTADLPSVCRRADILICAAGKANMVDASFIKPGAIVFDVGINTDENGKLCGDVDAQSVLPVASALTPVPGGVGGVTGWLLLEHVAKASYKHSGRFDI